MTAIRVVLVAIWVAILLVSRSIWTTPAAAMPSSPPLDLSTTAVSDDDAMAAPASGMKPRVDLYGNPIDTAVGDYRIDIRGDVYEHHDPDTAIADLAPPGV